MNWFKNLNKRGKKILGASLISAGAFLMLAFFIKVLGLIVVIGILTAGSYLFISNLDRDV